MYLYMYVQYKFTLFRDYSSKMLRRYVQRQVKTRNLSKGSSLPMGREVNISFSVEKNLRSFALSPQSILVYPGLRCFSTQLANDNFDVSNRMQSSRLEELIKENYRRYGHYEASLDPLDIASKTSRIELNKDFLNRKVYNSIDFEEDENGKSIDAMHSYYREIYAKNTGLEFHHIDDTYEREWLFERAEELYGNKAKYLTKTDRINAGIKMLQNEIFELFMAKKFSSFKRYSSEGAEIMSVAMDNILRFSSENNVDEAVIGIPHRGRLAYLVSSLDYPAHRLFWKVKGKSEFPASMIEDNNGTFLVDDVTSHIAASIDKKFSAMPSARAMHVSLLHNPSHLEIIGSVAAGKVKAKQDSGSNAVCLQVHGDAAMSGQGCVPETLSFSHLPGFNVDGTIHIVVNNQIGFTAEGNKAGRSSRYATDVGKITSAPVIHVRGDAVEDVILSTKLATEYRTKFKKDIFLDLIVYRKHGHNEVDEPEFTSPHMYKEIRNPQRLSQPRSYLQKLINDGVLTPEKISKLEKKLEAHLESELKTSENLDLESNPPDTLNRQWSTMVHPTNTLMKEIVSTGVDTNTLVKVGKQSTEVPKDFKMHQRLQRTFAQARLKKIQSGNVDWATAEAMAFGSLLLEGYNIRLCGQDAQRGTFSHRHAYLTDQVTGDKHVPFHHLHNRKGKFDVLSSNLSELAVLGFEYGYSWEHPNNLVLWEAQFGDFCNGAQIIIDQFISGSESKWLRQSGIVLLLPHGYDGAGPEHSSGRLERFLQLIDTQDIGSFDNSTAMLRRNYNTNMSVINPTTPANYFHALRRQMLRKFRKPLIVMGPKTLLRSVDSPLTDMESGSSFKQTFINNGQGEDVTIDNDKKAKAVVFISGKFYYDAVEYLRKNYKEDANEIVFIRVEELAPFPHQNIIDHIKDFNCTDANFIWLQEEAMNAGAWTYIKPHLERAIGDAGYGNKDLTYVGRPSLPAPAVGLAEFHKSQTAAIFKDFISII